MVFRVALLPLLLVALASCGGGGGDDGGGAAFQMVSSNPAPGTQSVSVDAAVLVTFSAPVDPASVNGDSIQVGVVGGGGATPGNTQVDPGDASGHTLRWIPGEPMQPAAGQTVVLAATLRSDGGAALGGVRQFTFRTGGANPIDLPPEESLRPAIGRLRQGRRSHTATLLLDGRVLVTGGFIQGTAITDGCELFFPATEAFVTTPADMVSPRANHTATLLVSGEVLLVGGYFESAPGQLQVLATAEIYNPLTGTFRAVDSLSVPRVDHRAELLPDGRVLITGGSDVVSEGILDYDDAEIFNPTTETFTVVPDLMVHARAVHTMTDMGNGRILLVGGHTGDLRPEWYVTSTGTFETLAVPALDGARFGACAARFDSGAVAVAGGDELGSVLHAHPNGTVQNTGSPLTRPRSYATATRVAPDRVLVTGGIDFSSGTLILPTCDMIIEGTVSGSRTYATEMRFPGGLAMHTATLLDDGRVMFCGGLVSIGGQVELDGAYIFTHP